MNSGSTIFYTEIQQRHGVPIDQKSAQQTRCIYKKYYL